MTEPALNRMLLSAFRSLDVQLEAALEDRGVVDLRPSQATALLLIERSGSRLSDLAHEAAISKQAMMQVVDDLESRGLVRRTADPGDARAKVVKLTAKGLRQRAAARRGLASVEAALRRRLGERRYEALRATLDELSTPEE